jgi:manganese/zinc/iron transport system permease protein
MQALLDTLLLQGGYNTTLVMTGAALLGAAGGAAGTFAMLRRRALISDGMSHATLPGIVLAFLLGHLVWGEGRQFWLLMAGASAAAIAGLACITALTRSTRLAEDAAIAIVLSSFFGAGIVLLTAVQASDFPGQAGLSGYLLGSTASMIRAEAEAIALVSVAGLVTAALLHRPLILVAFDEAHARALGLPVLALDFALMGLVLMVVVTGLKAAGLILVVALLIIPAVTARYWTESAFSMAVLAGGLGAAGAYLAAAISSLAPALPTGALIVLTQFVLMLLSLLIAPSRGLLGAWLRLHRLRRTLAAAKDRPEG